MDIDVILLQADKLSPAPQILPKLQAVLRDLNADIGEISALVKFDAALTAQIVRLGNSAFFGMSKPSKSVDEAICRLGMREIYNLVGLIVARQIFGEELRYYGLKAPNSGRIPFSLLRSWRLLQKEPVTMLKSPTRLGLFGILGKC